MRLILAIASVSVPDDGFNCPDVNELTYVH